MTQKKKYRKIQSKLELSFATIAAAISVILAIALFSVTRRQIRQDVRKRLADVVGVAALGVDKDIV